MYDPMSRHILLILFHCVHAYWLHLLSSYIAFHLFMKMLMFLAFWSLFVPALTFAALTACANHVGTGAARFRIWSSTVCKQQHPTVVGTASIGWPSGSENVPVQASENVPVQDMFLYWTCPSIAQPQPPFWHCCNGHLCKVINSQVSGVMQTWWLHWPSRSLIYVDMIIIDKLIRQRWMGNTVHKPAVHAHIRQTWMQW